MSKRKATTKKKAAPATAPEPAPLSEDDVYSLSLACSLASGACSAAGRNFDLVSGGLARFSDRLFLLKRARLLLGEATDACVRAEAVIAAPPVAPDTKPGKWKVTHVGAVANADTHALVTAAVKKGKGK